MRFSSHAGLRFKYCVTIIIVTIVNLRILLYKTSFFQHYTAINSVTTHINIIIATSYQDTDNEDNAILHHKIQVQGQQFGRARDKKQVQGKQGHLEKIISK